MNLWKKLKGSNFKKLQSLDKKLYFLLFIWCANLAKHPVKREWTKQLTQKPILKTRQAQY